MIEELFPEMDQVCLVLDFYLVLNGVSRQSMVWQQ